MSSGKAIFTILLAKLYKLFKFKDLISKYWPEFAQNGKENITILDLMIHNAGLARIDTWITSE